MSNFIEGNDPNALRAALERRYPGVRVECSFNNYGTYRGWCVRFIADDDRLLLDYGLMPRVRTAGWRPMNTELEGVSLSVTSSQLEHGWSCRAIVNWHIEIDRLEGARDRALTKKMQGQVLRLLKPFIRGTRKSKSR